MGEAPTHVSSGLDKPLDPKPPDLGNRVYMDANENSKDGLIQSIGLGDPTPQILGDAMQEI